MLQGNKECGASEYQVGCLIDVNSVLYVLESYSKTEDNELKSCFLVPFICDPIDVCQ